MMTFADKKISKLELARLMEIPVEQIATKSVTITFFELNEDGTRAMVGPSFAQQPKIANYKIELVEPGRPVGTTIANGAAAKRKLKPTKADLKLEQDALEAEKALIRQNETTEERIEREKAELGQISELRS